jgi:hypothetical protein
LEEPVDGRGSNELMAGLKTFQQESGISSRFSFPAENLLLKRQEKWS